MKLALLAPLSATAISLGLFQQHRLARLNERTAELSAHLPSPYPAPVEGTPPSSRRSAFDLQSMEGHELVPELTALANGLKDDIQAPDANERLSLNNPKVARLKELLASLGAGASKEWVATLDPEVRDFSLASYDCANPQQAFFAALADPSLIPAHFDKAAFFHDWGFVDPSGALEWFREARADHTPFAAEETVRTLAAEMESRVDPARAVEDLNGILKDEPKNLSDAEVRVIAAKFSLNFCDDKEGAAFIAAMNRSHPAEHQGSYFKIIRDQLVSDLGTQLVQETAEAGAALADQAYSAEQKLQFAKNWVSCIVASDWKVYISWAPWMAGLDAPADAGHPLRIMARAAATTSGSPEPSWLESLPESPVRTLAIQDYVSAEASSDPALASRWLTKLPAGPERRDLAAKISASLQASDPEGATKLLENEGAAH